MINLPPQKKKKRFCQKIRNLALFFDFSMISFFQPLQVKTKGYKKELAAGKMLYRGFSNLPGGPLVRAPRAPAPTARIITQRTLRGIGKTRGFTHAASRQAGSVPGAGHVSSHSTPPVFGFVC